MRRSRMTPEQLAADVARLHALPDDAWQPLSAHGDALHAAARKRGRPFKAAADRRVKAMVTFDPRLLVEVDAIAKAVGTSRSGLIESLLKVVVTRPHQ